MTTARHFLIPAGTIGRSNNRLAKRCMPIRVAYADPTKVTITTKIRQISSVGVQLLLKT